ncbi:hypothetical protein [Actinopolymorpha alba]|uniref:hypothetical protein n=1 Tax=Actinopolymorpha alba TaxID=533267 RepID=UPI000376C259|nr:hypothetical protein [Actinopolymorpha alba]
MVISDETITRLETAATTGDARAARELGRLLSLTATNPLDHSLEEEGPTWPEERWLRAALKAYPDDVETLILLTGRLAQQVSHGENGLELNPDGVGDRGEDEGPVERIRAEARELFAQIGAAGPGGDAKAGLQELAIRLGVSEKPPVQNAYSFYLLKDEAGSGSMLYLVSIVASDPDEIRWACDAWLRLSVGGFDESPVLVTYVDGAVVSSIDLGPYLTDHAVDWSAVAVPELTGTRLPAGLPVPGRGLCYGFSMSVD